MTAPSFAILDFKPRTAGTLRGFFSIQTPSGVVFHEMSLHTRNGVWWISFPSRPLLQDGVALRDASGKLRYSAPLIGFADTATRNRFTAAGLDALRQSQPDVFAAEHTAAS